MWPTPPSHRDNMDINAISLLELNTRISAALAANPQLNNVWVTGETSDLRCSGPHCYFELIEKNPETGTPMARARATIWGSRYGRLNDTFRAATGSPLTSGIKVMVQASVSYHPVYGLSLNITDVNPEFTLGDLLRRRREMLARLEAEGILMLNRQLAMPIPAQRIAVISAAGAAGYGDFINQLYTNRACLRFATRLFPAVMQGESAPASIIAALEQVAQCDDEYDCVVIIRGGGATGDLACFDNYPLAANIAMFPLPVIIGIGHERDVTLLDYVAHLRVKTPTAAAEWLIGRGNEALDRVLSIGSAILEAASSRINSSHRRLATIAGQLAPTALNVLAQNRRRVDDHPVQLMAQSVDARIARQRDRLTAIGQLIDTLSPQATLRRGFSITRVDGHAVTSADLPPGTKLTTTLATGEITSTVE